MPFPPRLPAQIQDFIAGARTVLDGFLARAADIAGGLRDKALFVVDKLLVNLPPQKRRMVLIGSMGGLAILLLVLAGASAAKNKPITRQAAVEGEAVRQGLIPPDEVFLPDEPDFVPGIILDREQRTSWTMGDVEILWQDPLKNGEEPWRNRIEQTIDEIMESVP